MPTILTHAAVPLAIAAVAGSRHISGRLLIAGVVASMLPDVDLLVFPLAKAYSSQFGHRGFSHSLAFAAVVGAIACACSPWLRATRLATFLFVALSCASHGLLDMLTNGGKGVIYLWPFTQERYFWPARVIQVSPFSFDRFLGPEGVAVIVTELRWIWLPALAVAGVGILLRRKKAAT